MFRWRLRRETGALRWRRGEGDAVVVVEEERETLCALSGVGVSISPFAQGGLNEALGLAIGFGRIGFGEAVLETERGRRRFA